MNCTGPTAKRRASKARTRRSLYGKVCRFVDQRDGGICRACQGPLSVGAHHHHIVFRSLGGKHTTENVCLVCPQCHLDIHAKRLMVTGNANESLQIERVA